MSTPVLSIDNPKGNINVNGPMIMNGAVNGPFITFLTYDDTTSRAHAHQNSSRSDFPEGTTNAWNPVAISHALWDVPSEYNHLQTKDLEIDASVDWIGETVVSNDVMFHLRLYYGPGLTSFVESTNNELFYEVDANGVLLPRVGFGGCGVIAQSHHADFNSTMDTSRVQSRLFIPNCPVSAGSQLKLELRFMSLHTNTLYTNRDRGDATNNFNHERGTTNYFMLIK